MRFGMAGRGRAGLVRTGAVGLGAERLGVAECGLAGLVRPNPARLPWYGEEVLGRVRLGAVRQAWHVEVGLGVAR